MEQDIDDLTAAGTDLIVVQLHTGFQFFQVKSSLTESAAHRAIDRGADLVVCHHPHVLQGCEWYKGKFIAYSLGNFIFDQDFLATFGSGVLRVVFEEDRPIEIRWHPLVLDNYRPVPVGGLAARRIIREVHERSAHPIRSERIQGAVRNVLRPPNGDAVVPGFVLDRNSALIEPGSSSTRSLTVDLAANEVADFVAPSLTRSRGPQGEQLLNVEFGRDMFGWGGCEDYSADAESRGGIHWETNDSYKRVEVITGAPTGVRCLRLRRSSTNMSRVLLRPVARITLAKHRFYDEAGGVATAVDGEPRYSVRFRARFLRQGATTSPLRRLSL